MKSIFKTGINKHFLYRVTPNKYKLTLQVAESGSLSASKTSGFSGDIVYLTATPSSDYRFIGYSNTGGSIVNNEFTFGDEDATAKAWFEYVPPLVLTLQTDGHGTISANALSGHNGDIITLSNTANAGYNFSGYSVTGATLNGSTITLNNQDATAKAWFEAARSAILYDNASEIKATTNGATAIKNINTPLTSYRYIGLNFDCKLNVDAYNKNMYSTIVISGLRNIIDNHWTIRAGTYEWGYRYYCKGVRYASNMDGYISYNSDYVNNRAGGYYYLANGAYDGSGNPMPANQFTTYKFVIDRKGDGISAYSIYNDNVYYLGQKTAFENYNYCTAIHNIKITDNLDCPLTAKNFKIAGFSDIASAIAWRG